MKLLAKILYRLLHSESYNNYKKAKLIQWCKINFKSFGENSIIPELHLIKNPQYISIGKNFSSLFNLRLEAWDKFGIQNFTPQLIIGDNVICNSDIHIGVINKVTIGNNCLLASRIYISDHYHGNISPNDLERIPSNRPLSSKGPVKIGENVWIGEGVCILPGVEIGDNCIIGANSVVNKSFPANVVIAGIPAKTIKNLGKHE